MRNRPLWLVLGIAAVLCSAPVFILAQEMATPDISGTWSRLREKGAAERGYLPLFFEFTKGELPMTPWAAAKYKANRAQYRESAQSILSDPVLSCYPPGLPRIYLLGFPVQIVQIPGQVIMLFEYDHFIRRIYTDGRPHDTDQGLLWMGDSIGKWEGDTLVTDTSGFNDKTLIDRLGHPHSTALHMVERIRKIDPKSLEIDLTVDDSKAFTKPWESKLIYELEPDWKIMEHVCEDNASFLKFNKEATQGTSKK
jgi:hypothetical protein